MGGGRQGMLLTCDPTIREFILNLNKGKDFVLEELDERHLFIDVRGKAIIERELTKYMDTITFEGPKQK